MPYITQGQRPALDKLIKPLTQYIGHDGELNYTITRLLLARFALPDPDYVDLEQSSNLSYMDLERCIGLLECIKLELYRRVVAPFEDGKAQQNGDVFEG